MSGINRNKPTARATPSRCSGGFVFGRVLALATLACGFASIAGCYKPVTTDTDVELNRVERELEQCRIDARDSQETIKVLRTELAQARGINLDDADAFAPTRIAIDRLSGGRSYDSQPGDDCVTVYFRPYDQFDDAIKIAGAIEAQLFDLQAPDGQRLVGEMRLSPKEAAEHWQGKLLTNHYTLEIPFSRRPSHSEITIRVSFTDAIWKRVMTAQEVRNVDLSGSN